MLIGSTAFPVQQGSSAVAFVRRVSREITLLAFFNASLTWALTFVDCEGGRIPITLFKLSLLLKPDWLTSVSKLLGGVGGRGNT
eukprot:g22637.t1